MERMASEGQVSVVKVEVGVEVMDHFQPGLLHQSKGAIAWQQLNFEYTPARLVLNVVVGTGPTRARSSLSKPSDIQTRRLLAPIASASARSLVPTRQCMLSLCATVGPSKASCTGKPNSHLRKTNCAHERAMWYLPSTSYAKPRCSCGPGNHKSSSQAANPNKRRTTMPNSNGCFKNFDIWCGSLK